MCQSFLRICCGGTVQKVLAYGLVVSLAIYGVWQVSIAERQRLRTEMEIYGRGFFNGTAADDPVMVEYVKTQKLIPPSTEPYNLADPNVFDTSGYGRAQLLDGLLRNMTGGFFVEVGAFDGERMSNTLHFEKFFNWTGLLIEASPGLFQQLQTKHRKAFSIHSCLSLHPVAELVHFVSAGVLGRITGTGNAATETIQCFPLYTLLLALERTKIDLFALDIEGDELKVLKTIPWEKVQMRLIEVEVAHVAEGKEAVKQYMESVGYTHVKDVNLDSIFVKKDFEKIPK